MPTHKEAVKPLNNSRARQQFRYIMAMIHKGYGRLYNDDKKLQWYHTVDITTNKFIAENKTRFLKTDMVASGLMTLEEW